MSYYTDEQREQILRQARELLREPPNGSATKHFPSFGETVNQRHRREISEQEAERERERRENDYRAIERRVTANVLAAVQGMIDNAIGTARADHVENFLPEFVSQFREELHDHVVNELERAYAKAMDDLRADLAALRQAVKKLAGDDSTVIDLPPLASMRRAKLN
jgi:hypothetical protein